MVHEARLGKTLIKTGDLDGAEELLVRTHRAFKAARGDGFLWTYTTHSYLVYLRMAREQWEAAAGLLRQSIESCRRAEISAAHHLMHYVRCMVELERDDDAAAAVRELVDSEVKHATEPKRRTSLRKCLDWLRRRGESELVDVAERRERDAPR